MLGKGYSPKSHVAARCGERKRKRSGRGPLPPALHVLPAHSPRHLLLEMCNGSCVPGTPGRAGAVKLLEHSFEYNVYQQHQVQVTMSHFLVPGTRCLSSCFFSHIVKRPEVCLSQKFPSLLLVE